MTLDFNTAGEQRSFDVIPAGTIVTLQLNIRPGSPATAAGSRVPKTATPKA